MRGPIVPAAVLSTRDQAWLIVSHRDLKRHSGKPGDFMAQRSAEGIILGQIEDSGFPALLLDPESEAALRLSPRIDLVIAKSSGFQTLATGVAIRWPEARHRPRNRH